MNVRCAVAIFWLTVAVLIAAPATPVQILGVVSSRSTFVLSRVDTRPEAGPLPVVDGDEVDATKAPVLFRLTGPNRVVLGGNSHAQIRPIHDSGRYFYLTKGSIQFDALREPLAICAAGRLYLPAVPASGEVVILENRRVVVNMTSGTMERNGKDACDAKGVPAFLLTGTVGASAGVAGAASAAAGAAGTVGAAGAAGAATAGAAAGAATVGAVSTGAVLAAGAAVVGTTAVAVVATANGATVPPAPADASVILPPTP